MAQPGQETDVTGDTVTDIAKPGQVHEQPLFEQRRQGVIQVCELGKSPKVLGDGGIAGCQPEEIRQYAEAPRNLVFKLCVHRRPPGREPASQPIPVHSTATRPVSTDGSGQLIFRCSTLS